ncbi:MAG: response regulator transcription factor [Helicobacteraceae bacterium]|nr:response regulator transcription factor [Candidatus Sulfurimonas ponti]MBL6973032.1 response regulator transcription factor [Sulfurimonas sp.]
MPASKKWNVLFIEENKSMFNSNTKTFNELFNKVDKVQDSEEALKLIDSNHYDILICDLSFEFADRIKILKLMKHRKPKIAYFALVTENNSDKIFGVADQGIHVFELEPSQFDLALEEISRFNLYVKK